MSDIQSNEDTHKIKKMLLLRILRKLAAIVQKRKFKSCGQNTWFDPLNSKFSYSSIHLGSNVFIGGRAWFSSSHSTILIGDNVMFGPSVHIYGGNHRYDCIGTHMNKIIKHKNHKDKDIIIENETWIGGSSIILTGVTIGKGAIIGAGSVVTKDITPYSINAGNPCRYIKMRFTPEQIREHENQTRI